MVGAGIWVLALAALILGLMKQRKIGAVFAWIQLLIVLLCMFITLPQWLMEQWQEPYAHRPLFAWGERNMIVMLGAGTTKIAQQNQTNFEPSLFGQSRLLETASLYRSCKNNQHRVCKVIVSGGDPQKHGKTEAEIYKKTLHALGVISADILLDDKSLNTWQNAQFTREILRQQTFDRLLLVSSAFHLPRSMLYFEHFGLAPIPIRADYLSGGGKISSLNLLLLDFYVHEVIGIIRYNIYNKLGWNPAKEKAGQS